VAKNNAKRTAVAMLIMSLVITIVVTILVRWVINTRTDDIKDTNCAVIARQVAGLDLQLQQSKLFRDFDASPQIRFYFTKVVPLREASLERARADLVRLRCPE
jgi:competence protein ComGC